MKRYPKIGLLPLYLKLYDDTLPAIRSQFDPFLDTVRTGLGGRGATVVSAPVCRVVAEVKAAIALFAKQDVDCVVTVHLAYSPSLESAPALAKTKWPLIVLDTTMDAQFGPQVDPARIMFNHGIHGVMDFCSILRRHGRAFEVVAGHVTESNALERVTYLAEAAVAARRFRGARTVRLGKSFPGMGDFAVAEPVLRRRLGIEVEQLELADLTREMKAVTPAAIAAEVAEDRRLYKVAIDEARHRQTVHAGLGLRRLLARRDYTGFSVNFQAFDEKGGPAMPFAEISKAMARGIGFGGEGDVFTGALVGALITGFGVATFTEIFCSDWRGDSLFLSHMGEINPVVAASRPLLAPRDFAFLTVKTAALVCGVKAGPAVYVNLVPGPDETFDFIVAPVEMLADTKRKDLQQCVRGWMRPRLPVPQFLEAYSRHGGTHHGALVLGDRAEALCAFARFAGVGLTTL